MNLSPIEQPSGFAFLAVRLAELFGISLILVTMVMSSVIVTLRPEHGRHIRYTIEKTESVIFPFFRPRGRTNSDHP
jgi:hypothetical protein